MPLRHFCLQNIGFQVTESPADDPRDFSGTYDHSEPERTAGGGREVISECIQALIQPSDFLDFLFTINKNPMLFSKNPSRNLFLGVHIHQISFAIEYNGFLFETKALE